MPVLPESGYISPFYMFSGHLETILPALFRTVGDVVYSRERIITSDNDFLDLDWSKVGSDRVVIISHGLEGDSHRPYAKGMANSFNKIGWDAMAWNYRGCSGEMNKKARFYHSGETTDLDFVIKHVLKDYKTAVLVGISIGGNITLKYLGEKGDHVDPKIKTGVAFSVPCHLEAGANHLSKFSNKIYLSRFLKSLEGKIKSKEACIPGTFDLTGIEKIASFQEFDDRYTAPLNGFANAKEYWRYSSSIHYLSSIKTPTLLVNAMNDPFLPEECFPKKEAKNHPYLHLEMPDRGGHVGFFQSNIRGYNYWSEERAIEFIKNYT